MTADAIPAEAGASAPAESAPLPPQLAEALRSGPFHRALCEAIAHRGLSLARLSAHLDRMGTHVGQSTLSYWQRGLRHPEMPRALTTVRALETVLRLTPGSLAGLLTVIPQRNRPSGAATDRLGFVDLADSWAETTALLAEFDALPDTNRCNADLEVLSVHDSVVIGANREHRTTTSRIVVRALRPGPDRYLALHHGDDGCRIEQANVRAAEGCRPGRIRRQPASRGLVAELLFDRRLAAGEVHVFCFSVHDGSGGPTPGQYRMFRAAAGHYLLQMTFNPAALPARCSRRFRVREGAEPAASEDLMCSIGGVASAYFSHVDPGLAGIDVEWS